MQSLSHNHKLDNIKNLTSLIVTNSEWNKRLVLFCPIAGTRIFRSRKWSSGHVEVAVDDVGTKLVE